MARIKYNIDIMKYISVVESITRAHVKDCIVSDPLLFIIQENEMGKAIGKKGLNLKKVESVLKKKVKFVEFSEHVPKFVSNYLHPLKITSELNENTVTIKAPDTKTRGLVIGRERKNLNQLQDILKRFFPIEEVKVE